ncbi:hypothetical protein BCV70DRAFT_200446 [Testicularia cyperi]|uniref:RING-type E3 ubiquitin transferase n=1 Tax=Testicularia cyperi TaxID=1882483 RepID=A0A317XQX1_9BASI|nr:hypothetical protein BCV70DRAFT_200446 [Testicularia cyperi]
MRQRRLTRRFPAPAIVLLLLNIALLSQTVAGGWLFGSDTLGPVRDAIKVTQRLQSEILGWYNHNITQQGNWTFTLDPPELQTLWPADYRDRDLGSADGAYYANVTGFYKGKWQGWDVSTAANRSLAIDTRMNSSLINDNQLSNSKKPDYLPGVNETLLRHDRGSFPWLSKRPAQLNLRLEEEHIVPGNVSLVKGSFSVDAPEASGDEEAPASLGFSIEGLHFIRTGSLFLAAVADEAQYGTDVRDVMSMIPQGNAQTSNRTVTAIDKAFQARLDMLQRIIDSGSYDSSGDDNSSPPTILHNCSLHIYGQFTSAGNSEEMQEMLATLEYEIDHPTGIRTLSPAPPLLLSISAYSPNCHFVLAARDVEGLLETRLWKKAINYALIYFVILFIQTRLLVQQMEVTRTPSGLNKVSYRTFVAQSILDAYGALAHLSVAIALENETTMPLIACAFMSAICFLAFGYRYTLTIFRNQIESQPAAQPTPPPPLPIPASASTVSQTAPLRSEPARLVNIDEAATEILPSTEPNTTSTAGASVQTSTGTASPPDAETTDTATPATTAAAAEAADEAGRRRMAVMAMGGFLFMTAFFPLLVAGLMLPILYSFWMPQIHRNIQRGTRRAIQKRCVIGTTLCRLFLPLYIFACPRNVLFFDPNPWVFLLVGYLMAQMLLLLAQDVFGPHFFLPVSWIPEGAMTAWEYHPPVKPTHSNLDAEGAGVGVRIGSSPSEASAGIAAFGDCAICLNAIETERHSQRARRRKQSQTKRRGARHSAKDGYSYDAVLDDSDGSDAEAGAQISHDVIGDEDDKAEDSRNLPLPTTSNVPRQHHRGRLRSWRSWVARGIRQGLRWKDELGAAGSLRRRRTDVMVAPCQHAFHTECLERWLTIKTECPSCRSALPPV